MYEYEMMWCNGSLKWIPSYWCEDGMNCEECEYYIEKGEEKDE